MRDIKPTAERLAKGDVTEVYVQEQEKQPPEKRYRSSGALYALRRAGTITDAHVAAAELWARDYETGVLGARDPEAGRKGGVADPHTIMLARAAAVSRCEYVRKALGAVGETLLRRMMIDGMSVQAIAEAGSTHKLRVSGALELLLDQLVEALDRMPGRLW
ncbi:hypothetical protein FOH24_07695 [Acetobacter tropicalis]|uniref:Uncharacterized protein n=1 Tax=Acetobacter tropicalis TaxID=104102 RepID=A0A094YMS7_9PROT|nr:hypothetical protein [Acetobacter tropicalis]KAA8384039.1 hypothetical protein FOH22_15350 [Acetobacter tropicalis]KAA8391254.1 hypothetical protein FOH24_07695 [Acetobacter tropicalis]KGB21924.1 hypothetical protein AtDm6_2690 [Acetobacter tropicalis]MDO8173234.1 hypothetical protein [Acetobacter tropicalis]